MVARTHGVSHLGIGVRDLDRTIAFYGDVLGFVLVDRYGYQVPSDPSLPDNGNAKADENWWREVAVMRVGLAGDDPVIVSLRNEGGQVESRTEMDDVGTHHWGVWVTEIDNYVRRLESGGELCVPLRTFESARAWGEPNTISMRSCTSGSRWNDGAARPGGAGQLSE